MKSKARKKKGHRFSAHLSLFEQRLEEKDSTLIRRISNKMLIQMDNSVIA